MRYQDMDARGEMSPSLGWLRVLASGSSGNCSVLVTRQGSAEGSRVRACLIDAGLSPRRTQALLQRCGLTFEDVDGVLLTHLDHDHWHSGWVSAWPRKWLLWMGTRHAAFARRRRLAPREAVRTFEDRAFEPSANVGVRPIEASHDELGVASFRIDIRRDGLAGSLGFATDLGRVPEQLVEGLRDVDVLAIESNYCPGMQMASSRPWFLKQRIMGGHGHLSNEQALEAVVAISPREHVVLLHLSRECNDPGLVASLHAGSDYALTIASQEEATRWVKVPARAAAAVVVLPSPGEQMDMFPVGGQRDAR